MLNIVKPLVDRDHVLTTRDLLLTNAKCNSVLDTCGALIGRLVSHALIFSKLRR